MTATAGGKRRPRPKKAAKTDQTKRDLIAAIGAPDEQRYVLRLYITGLTAASTRALDKVRAICDERLRGRYELEVIDIYQTPQLASDHQIVATPTLIKVLPDPLRRYVGDLSRIDRLLFGLDLREKS